MKKLIPILLLVILVSCEKHNNGKNTYIPHVEDMEYNVDTNTNYIAFYWQYVEDVIYYKDDNGFIIEYNDPDVFDFMHLKELTKRDKWFGEDSNSLYIPIQIDNQFVSKFLMDYNDSLNEYDWIIVEKWIPEVEDILWYLEPR